MLHNPDENNTKSIRAAACAAIFSLGAAPGYAQDIVSDEMLLKAGKHPNSWLMASRDYAGTRYSPPSQVNTETINRLVPKWTFSFGVLDAQNTTPLVHNWIMYATVSHGR